MESILPNCRIAANPANIDRLAARWVIQQGGNVTLDLGEMTDLSQLPRGDCQLWRIDLADRPQVKGQRVARILGACPTVTSVGRRVRVARTTCRVHYLTAIAASGQAGNFVRAGRAAPPAGPPIRDRPPGGLPFE